MKLAIFDIDGTLTHTNFADKDCYLRTIREQIRPDVRHYEEESFTHFTDSCMVVELHERYAGAAPSPAQTAAFQSRYFEMLRRVWDEDASHFAAVRGAEEVLLRLRAEGWAIALATGCWRESAQIKLGFAGVKLPENAPLSTASEGYSRQDIVKNAIHWAQETYAQSAFEHTVYIGDGVWDLRTCASLALPFVGIDVDNNARRQELLGAHCLLKDYSDWAKLTHFLENATAPK